jgi:phage repressor protein C with HTH and peptisase S24 domain
MFTHAQIWAALDRLAARSGLSASGLAKKAGLDPTTFNKSKRVTPDGRERWPSTESLAKSLAATGTSLGTFVHLIDDGAGPAIPVLPSIRFEEAAANGYFNDHGIPTGQGWGESPFPSLTGDKAYALEIAGDHMAPVYRDGTILIVLPAAAIRKGDRVVAMTKTGEVTVQELKRRTQKSIEFTSVGSVQESRTLEVRDVLWMARIVWASQ